VTEKGRGGIYVHVPFCKSRCIYCDFYSTVHSAEWQERYVDALQREVTLRHTELVSPADTLYIGGGTPSQLSPSTLLRLFRILDMYFTFTPDAEVTIEANPEDVTEEWLAVLRDTPVNRISMGVQTFDDSLLALLRRRHSSRDALQAVERCRKAGFDNLSLDLMYGLPGQTYEQWKTDVEEVLHLGVPHLSAYALQVEDGTLLGKYIKEGKWKETDEELYLAFYEYLLDAVAQAGMNHYEISNFCLPGFHSRHNSSYWAQAPYLGLGPGAHSYDGDRHRRWNKPGLRAYVENAGVPPHGEETLSDNELYDELVMTRLRTSEGLSLSLLSEENKAYCLAQAATHLHRGKLTCKNDVLRLTRKGIFTSDDIMSDLMR